MPGLHLASRLSDELKRVRLNQICFYASITMTSLLQQLGDSGTVFRLQNPSAVTSISTKTADGRTFYRERW